MKIPFFHKKNPVEKILTTQQNESIVQAIRNAEMRTSGEIRVFMESHCKYVDAMDRAQEVFWNLKMNQTEDRNAVLLYFAVSDHQFAIYGDEGIYLKTGAVYWQTLAAEVSAHFRNQEFAKGIESCVQYLGEGLHHFFPFDRTTDHNELPDNIVFGQ